MPLTQDALARAQATIAELRTADTGGDIRWVRPEGLHITLAFLGQVPPEAVPAVIDALAEVPTRQGKDGFKSVPLAPPVIRKVTIHQ